MTKPVIASSFFTFPRFLLWSLPLFFLLLTAWLRGGLDSSAIPAFLTRIYAEEKPIIQNVSPEYDGWHFLRHAPAQTI